MLGFLIFSYLFSDNKTNKGSKFLPYPSKELIKLTKKHYGKTKRKN